MPDFLDYTKIHVRSGDGGDGVVRFRREKYVPAGGPSGGNGGDGGHVLLKVDPGLNTLGLFRRRSHFQAENGRPGEAGKRAGRSGADLEITVPPGTVVRDAERGEILADLTEPGETALAARGGRGGRGNSCFTTSTRQAPAFAEKGEAGEELWLELELKLVADVGLVGFPNAGKSTLLSVISQARPKVAGYPFTTLVPHLGVVETPDGSGFVAADIPGLIEGAHQGVGLGQTFLRHIERTRMLVHVIDCAAVDGRDPVEDYRIINAELAHYQPPLDHLPQLVAANKMDLPDAQVGLERLQVAAEKDGRIVVPISGASSQGIKRLLQEVRTLLGQLDEQGQAPVRQAGVPGEKPGPEERVIYRPRPQGGRVQDFSVRCEDGVYVVEGEGLERFLARMDLDNEEVLRYLQRLFRKIGLYDELARREVAEGAVVRVAGVEFEYQP